MTKASQWRAHVEGWRASGQTAAAYCAERGLKVASLRYWSSRVREQERGGSASVGKDGEVRLAQVRSSSGEATPSASVLRLCVGELTLEVPAAFDRGALREVVSMVLELAESRP